MDPLGTFIARMDRLVDRQEQPRTRATGASQYLKDLLAEPAFLAAEHRVANADRYTQHLVHVHPRGHYSIVALVWLPGQATPIHDHHCWCVVGVLQGAERETRYNLTEDHEGQQTLVANTVSRNEPGSVCALVPPAENIHRVENAGDGTAISIHVYGADIAVLGSSVNQVFTEPVRSEVSVDGKSVAWRTSKARQ